ncbi:MAG: CHAT domain-containing protein [Caldilineaceae bacterium]|nr:CHAT domain-containing protein [Caldilineaceae bacterium]
MSITNYVNFDLMVEKTGDEYRARVLNSPAGEATITFQAPFSALELENFTLRLGQSQRRVRRIDSPEMQNAKLFGQRLFETIFAGEIGACLRSSITQASLQNAGLRLRLRLSDARDLMDIPWEYLYDGDVNRFLSLSIDTPLVRYLDQPGHITPLLVKPPLKVLAVISSPTDYLQLNVEEEWGKLREAVSELERVGLLQLARLDVATLEQLQRQLRRDQYHVFHFIGHGGFDEVADDGVLLMEDEQGRGRAVSGQTLGMLMHDEKSLRLALLNACEGGRTSATDPFSGVGQSLLRQGIPAVIAMQREVTDDTAITMAHSFYAALADGYPVDAALTEARKSIFVKNDLEWGTPVLYMRSPDGQIFDVDQAALAVVHKEHAETVPGPLATPAPLVDIPHDAPAEPPVADPNTRTAQSTPAAPTRRTTSAWVGIALLVLGAFGAWTGYKWLTGPSQPPLAPTATVQPEDPNSGVAGGASGAVATAVAATSKEEVAVGETATDAPTSTPAATVTSAQPVVAPAIATDTPTATPTPTSRPAAANCVGASDPPIQVGDTASVCTGSGETVSIRRGPGGEYATVVPLNNNATFEVVSGPQCGNYGGQQFKWWQILYNGTSAWIVDGRDSRDDYFICRQGATATIREGGESNAQGDFAGAWTTNFAHMNIRQDGNQVTGFYTQYDSLKVTTFSGEIAGDTLTGVNERGTHFTLSLTQGGAIFAGEWFSNGHGYQWCGVRSGSLPDGCGFSGRWLTHSGKGWIEMKQTGEQITGSYFNGADKGTLTGNFELFGRTQDYSLNGRYTASNDSGEFRFVDSGLSGLQFQGCWLDDAKPSNPGDWCGWRQGQNVPAQCRPTTCP